MSWLGRELKIGRTVCCKDDPRHVGVIRAVVHGLYKVQWCDTGWISFVHAEEIRRLEDDEQ